MSSDRQSAEANRDFSGFIDANVSQRGPRDEVDLDEEKEELVSLAESDHISSTNSSDCPSDNKTNIVTSTPFTTPVTSPDRQACLDSGTKLKSLEIFKSLERGIKPDSRTGVASELDQAKGDVVSPIRNSEEPLAGSNSSSSDSESDLGHSNKKKLVVKIMAPKFDDTAVQKLADKLGNMSSSAETDVERSKTMYDAREHTPTAVMKGMLKRLEHWHERLEKIEKESVGYKGTAV